MGGINVALGTASVALAAVLTVLLVRWQSSQEVIESGRLQLAALQKERLQPGEVLRPTAAPVQIAQQAPTPAASPVTREQSLMEWMSDPRMIEQRKKTLRAQMTDIDLWVKLPADKMTAYMGYLVERGPVLSSYMNSAEKKRAIDEISANSAARRAELVKLVGQAAADQLEIYGRTHNARSVLRQMNQRLPAADALSPETYQQAATAMSEYDRNTGLSLADSPTLQATDDPFGAAAAMERNALVLQQRVASYRSVAAQFLSPRQMTALKGLLQEQVDSMRVNREVTKLELELKP